MTRALLFVPAMLVHVFYWVVMPWPLLLSALVLCLFDLDPCDDFGDAVFRPLMWADYYVPSSPRLHIIASVVFAIVEFMALAVWIAWRLT